MIFGYDAVPSGVPHLPPGAHFYMGYVDGEYVSYPLIRRRFPHANVIPISVWGGEEPVWPALILDVEKGNPTPPARVPWWVTMQRAHGYKLSELGVYASLKDGEMGWPAIEPHLRAAGMTLGRNVAADWTSSPHLPEGFAACQYESLEFYDATCALEGWLDPDPVPRAPHETSLVKVPETPLPPRLNPTLRKSFADGFRTGYVDGWRARGDKLRAK